LKVAAPWQGEFWSSVTAWPFDIICLIEHNGGVSWNAYFHPKFKVEFDKLSKAVQDELLASLTPLRVYGPALGRPEVDTLKGSSFANMKELRFRASGGVWRVAFAFDPARAAILLVAGDKSGVSEKKFYKRFIDKADKRYREHLDGI
jgi:hypothetical protein